MNNYKDLTPEAIDNFGSELPFELGMHFQSKEEVNKMAKEAILNNNFNFNEFKNKYGSGETQAQKDFGYQFGLACSTYATDKIVKEVAKNKELNIESKKALEQNIQAWSHAVITLNNNELIYSINHLKHELANQIQEFAEEKKQYNKTLPTRLKTEIKEIIFNIFKKEENCTPEKSTVLADRITGYDRLLKEYEKSPSFNNSVKEVDNQHKTKVKIK